jgi:outer membrane cobalamin receptor
MAPSPCRGSVRPRASSPFTFVLMTAVLLWATGGVAAAASLSGLVLDPDGRAAPGARVLVWGSTAVVATAVSDDAGRFHVASLAPGAYEVRVALAGFRADSVRVDLAPDADLQITIPLRLSAVAESVVVTAAQVDRPLSRVPDTVTILTAADLEARQVETVADALRLVPGLTVSGTGGRGALTALFPRGAESDSTLVLVDGVRVNAFGGGFDFGHLSLAGVERIEIVRGPQSALHGSDAIGGVVQIVTRHGGPTGAGGIVEHGSFDTTRLSIASSGSAGPWTWGAAAERLASDGFTGQAGGGERVSNDAYDRHSASLSGAWRRGRDTSVRGDLRIERSERGFPGPFGSDPAGTFAGVDRISRGTGDTLTVAVGARHAWTPAVQQRVFFSTADLEGAFVSPFGDSITETTRRAFRTQADFALSHHLGASAGVEVQAERARSSFIVGSAATPIPIRRVVAGYFVEGRLDAADRFLATAGLRVEQIRRHALEPDGSAFGVRPAFGPDTVVSANPKLSLAWFLEPEDRRAAGWTRLRLSAGTGIRPPDAFEIAFTDNPALRPERSRSVDVGIERALAGGAVLFEATAFASRFDDLIVAVGRSFRDASRFQTDNISNARARGIELQGTVRTARGLQVGAAYTWTDTEILAVDRGNGLAPPPFTPGDPLLRRPRHQGALDLLVARGRLTAYARLGARGAALDVEPAFGAFGGLFRTPGYGVVDAGSAVRITRRLALTLRGTNLLDRRYEEALGFPALGRSVTVGVRVAAGR